MNYIELINAFWNKSESDNISGSDIAVYMALLKYCNKLNWLNPFVCHWDIVCQYSKVSKNTFYKSIEILNDKGYIKFEKGVKNSSIKPKVFILKFENKEGIIQEQLSNKQGLKAEQEGNLYKLLNIQTFKLLNDNISTINSNLENFNLNLENFFSEHSNNIPENFEKEKSSAKKEKFDFRLKLIQYGFDEKLVDDWLEVRKNKKATNSETAFNSFITEIEKRNCNINDMLQIAVEKSWSGFKHEWIDNLNSQHTNNNDYRSNAINAVNTMFGSSNKEMHHNR